MRVCLFEDQAVANLEPLVLTRPAFELLCGQSTLGSKQCGYFAPSGVGAMIRPYLAELLRQQQPHVTVNDPVWLRAETTLLVNGRWLPPASAPPCFAGPCVGLSNGEVAYALITPERLAACSPDTLDHCLESWKELLPNRQAGGCLVRYPWELVDKNREQLCRDYEHGGRAYRRGLEPGPLAVVGPAELLSIDPTAQVEPMSLADTSHGPVVVERGARIAAFSRLEGPCYIGARTQILGAKIRSGTTIGPDCRVGGEVEASIIHGHTNKYHDGFLGHSYVGEWVNFGAGTQNSDLRNDYRDVSVPVQGRQVATGLTKVGCFIGDHTKTGLNTLLNTGTTVGVFCNLLPTGHFLPRRFPSFSSWWNGMLVENGDLPRLLSTASLVMNRRGCSLSEAEQDLFRYLFEQTQADRQQVLQAPERQRLRRSA
jgi:UDP-N-acetylglucosamine diphosphorylase/glucosamine-1-phosphate N-acetyltransferase